MVRRHPYPQPGVEFFLPGVFFFVVGFALWRRPDLRPQALKMLQWTNSMDDLRAKGVLCVCFASVWTLLVTYLEARPYLGC